MRSARSRKASLPGQSFRPGLGYSAETARRNSRWSRFHLSSDILDISLSSHHANGGLGLRDTAGYRLNSFRYRPSSRTQVDIPLEGFCPAAYFADIRMINQCLSLGLPGQLTSQPVSLTPDAVALTKRRTSARTESRGGSRWWTLVVRSSANSRRAVGWRIALCWAR
jgi:hypothetical protein